MVKVGDIEVLPVVDGTALLDPVTAFPGTSPQSWAVHQGFLRGGMLELTLGGFLVLVGQRRVLVDTGVGPVTSGAFRGGQLVRSLTHYGFQPEDITDVAFTHLHWDHIGWASVEHRAVFPNATYRCHRRDWEYFNQIGNAAVSELLGPVEPQMVVWDESGSVCPGLDFLTAPGHTPGSTIFVISSGPKRALLLGDVVHCPVELVEAEWGAMGDVDPELAKRTRDALAQELEGTGVTAAAAHFPGLRFGRLLAAKRRRSWAWVPDPTAR